MADLPAHFVVFCVYFAVSRLLSEEEIYWRNVRMSFVSPYFHVLMTPRNWNGGEFGFTVLIANVGDLQLALHHEESVVREVQVVTPGLVNRTGAA
jgi:hypothetical protein